MSSLNFYPQGPGPLSEHNLPYSISVYVHEMFMFLQYGLLHPIKNLESKYLEID